MIEVRFHGRGGQGAVIASNLLADAAFKEGNDVQSFPYFGVERRGAPVTAFTRIDHKRIYNKSQIYEPNFVVVLDTALLDYVNVVQGLKEGGKVLINSKRGPEAFKELGEDVATVDATSIAIDIGLGSKVAPITNTAILGAFAKYTGIVKIDSVVEAIAEGAPTKKDENVLAAKEAYNKLVMGD